MLLGALCDRRLTYEYADETIRLTLEHSGLDVAARAQGVVGRHLGLALGLAGAALKYVVKPAAAKGPSPQKALADLSADVTAAAIAYSGTFDLERGRRLPQLLEPLAALKHRIPNAAFLINQAMVEINLGRRHKAFRDFETVERILETDRLTPLPNAERILAIGTVHYSRAFLLALEHDPVCLEHLERLMELDSRFLRLSGDLTRVAYHRVRGEEQAAREIEERIRIPLIQLGSPWLSEYLHQWSSSAVTRCATT